MNLLDRSLGQLARNIPGATGLFNKYNLDFCCGGSKSLRQAAQQQQLDTTQLLQDLSALMTNATTETDFNALSYDELIDYIYTHYHQVHRAELPELIRLAEKVETVHAEHPECPPPLFNV